MRFVVCTCFTASAVKLAPGYFWCIFCFPLHSFMFISSRCGVFVGSWHTKSSLNITPSIPKRIFASNIRTHPLMLSPSPSSQKIDPPKLAILQISVNNSKSYSRAGHGGNSSRWKSHNKKIPRLNKSWNISMETNNFPENRSMKIPITSTLIWSSLFKSSCSIVIMKNDEKSN